VNLGFQNDMLAVLDCCDLYINPKRKGGGTSAFEAMYKGMPLVTLPVGDVGLAAGADFQAADYDEMIRQISEYKADREYYEVQSRRHENAEKN
jgi:glycosyltransferase involved in cell wall biosynthesis